jgi:CHAD domain-containing protein
MDSLIDQLSAPAPLNPPTARTDRPEAGLVEDPARASDLALERLLQWRQAHLQQGLLERIAALRRHPAGSGGAGRTGDREDVHQLRTGLRRLRSMAEAFPGHWQGPSPRRLRRLARQAGRVRDLDVLMESLEEHQPSLQGKERKQLRRTLRTLGKQRTRARRKLAANLRRPPARLIHPPAPAAEAAAESEATRRDAHRAALPLLRASLIRQLASLRLHPGWGDGERPRPGSGQERSQHELRKEFKRFRYQLELLEALEPDLRDRLLTLKQTQNSLGLLQDLRVWRGLLKRHVKGPLRRRLPGLSARWRRQADGAWDEWRDLRCRWLDPSQGLEAWQRWLLDLEIPAG